MKKVEILVFLYNGLKFIDMINSEFLNQEHPSFECNIKYILTDTGDGSLEKLKQMNLDYHVVDTNEFSHSLTREKFIMETKSDIVILLTQDARLYNNDIYEKLAGSIDDDVKFSFVRQVNKNFSIERYTRMMNYPKKERTYGKEDIKKYGLSTFFASDACSCIDANFFKKIGGYGRDLPTNEDMFYAYKVIQNGKYVKYISNTYIVHSHSFSLKQTEKRYYLFGMFFGQCPEFDEYSANKSGMLLAIKVILRIILELNIFALLTFIPNMLVRYIGKKKGYKVGLKKRSA